MAERKRSRNGQAAQPVAAGRPSSEEAYEEFNDPLDTGLSDPVLRYGVDDPGYREPTTVLQEDAEMFATLAKLNKDLERASILLGVREMRFLVDLYYQIQKLRKGAYMQVKLAQKVQQGGEGEEEPKVVIEPNEFIDWLFRNMRTFENNIKRALDKKTDAMLAGEWCKSHVGVGPVISAGFLSHFDPTKAPKAGNYWSFAGLNPNMKWEKGQRRPWNGRLKVLSFLLGQTFTKFSNHKNSTYGRYYIFRREREIKQNWRGDNKNACIEKLENFNIDKKTDAYAWYSGSYPQEMQDAYFNAVLTGEKPPVLEADKPGAGKQCLPPARILLRSQRIAVKLFISHLHHVMYEIEYNHPPEKPYVFTELGHEHFIPPFNWINKQVVIQHPGDVVRPRTDII